MARVVVGRAQDVTPGQGCVMEAGDKTLAVFSVDGRLYAIDNACPHRGGPLGEGDLDGPLVSCPWHAWRWDVTTGANANNPAVRVGCYPVSVEGADLVVELP